MKRLIPALALLLLPLELYAKSIQDYGFGCDPGTFIGCSWVGAAKGTPFAQIALSIVARLTSYGPFGVPLVWGIGVIGIWYGAIRIIASRGNSDGIEKGKKAIMWSVIGLIAMLLSITIINFIAAFLYKVGG